MKIALIAPTAIPANTANSLQVMKMAQAIQGLGHELGVFAPGKQHEAPWDELAAHYGLREKFDIHWLPRSRFLRGYGYAFRAVFRARTWGADLIYTRMPQAAAYASQTGLPTIFEIHDLPKRRIGARLIKLFLSGMGARRLVTISHALADVLARNYPIEGEMMLVAPDGVDLERYADLPTPEQARAGLELKEGFTVGYTGHLYVGRGIDLILAMARELPDVNFLIAGGRREDVLRAQNELQAHTINNVWLTGFVPNAQIARYQAASDVLLMPYQKKVAASSGGDIAAFLSPMKMFEYLASGRPILASDLPVLGEVLNERNAIILPHDDLAAWVRAIKNLRDSADLRQNLAAEARKTAAKHSWEARARAILKGQNAED